MWLLSALRVPPPPPPAPGARRLPAHWGAADFEAFAELLRAVLGPSTPVLALPGEACAQALAHGLRFTGSALVCLNVDDAHAKEWEAWLQPLDARWWFAPAPAAGEAGTAWLESDLKVPLLRAIQRALRGPDACFAGIGCASLPLIELAGYTADPVEMLALVERTLVHRLAHAATGVSKVDWERSLRMALAERIAELGLSDEALLLLRGDRSPTRSLRQRSARREAERVGLATWEFDEIRLAPLALALRDPVVWTLVASMGPRHGDRDDAVAAQTQAARALPTHLLHYPAELMFDAVEAHAVRLLTALIGKLRDQVAGADLDPSLIKGCPFFRSLPRWGLRVTDDYVTLRLRVADLHAQGLPLARALHATFELLDRPAALASLGPREFARSFELAGGPRGLLGGALDLLRFVALARTRSTRKHLQLLRALAARDPALRARVDLRKGHAAMRQAIAVTLHEAAAAPRLSDAAREILAVTRAREWSASDDHAEPSESEDTVGYWGALCEARLNRLQSSSPEDPPGARFAVAVAALVRGDLDLAEEIARQEHERAQPMGYAIDAAYADELLASVARERGQLDQALGHLLTARQLYAALGDRHRLRNVDTQIRVTRG